jgi:membrane associated rhomboid family serine protease
LDFWYCYTSVEIKGDLGKLGFRSNFEEMGEPLIYEILKKLATSVIIAICGAIWFYMQKKNIGYSHVGLSYETAMEGQYWRIITSASSHISVIHLVLT